MQIICISRGSQSKGAEFGAKLASNLGFECIDREYLLERATSDGIPIGKLETAILKPHTFSDRLLLELDHYKALATSILCEKALSHDIVYHGRTGHLLLTGVEHILKIRVVADMEYRIQLVMEKLDLPRKKAQRYIEQVEDDRRRWVKRFYNVEWDVSTLYDSVLNLSHMSTDNAALAICAMAQLPEFRATPSSVAKLRDLYLAARARLILARDRRTSQLGIKVRSVNQVVYITYLGQEVKNPEILIDALKSLDDAREIVCTRAETNILWIQESFDSGDESYGKIMSLANTWDAAVELVKLTEHDAPEISAGRGAESYDAEDDWRRTGIIGSGDEPAENEPADLSKAYMRLVSDGKAGGRRIVKFSRPALINAVDRTVNYRMVVFDNVFLNREAAVRKRLCREWSHFLSESLKLPVMNLDEITSEFHFGARQLARMLIFAILSALVVYSILSYDREILSFLYREGTVARTEAVVAILLFVSFFAYIYSTVTRMFLKMIRLD
jgi:cytidylate kinase